MYKIINCPLCGKIIPDYVLKAETKRKTITCPECGSQRNCKNGLRKTNDGKIQTYLCQECGHRFT